MASLHFSFAFFRKVYGSENRIIPKRGFLLGLLCFVVMMAFSQEQNDLPEKQLQQIINEADEAYGIDQQLANGIYFEDIWHDAIGHPYFFEDAYVPAGLVYKQKSYTDVPVKYDIYQQRLLVWHNDPHAQYTSVLINDYITEFTINGKLFRRKLFKERAPAFYQVIVDAEPVGCYYTFSRKMDEVITDRDKYVPSFSETTRKNYLCLEGTLSRFRNNRSFARAFPPEIRRDIRHFLKSREIRVDDCTDVEMKEVIHFCTGLYSKITPGQ